MIAWQPAFQRPAKPSRAPIPSPELPQRTTRPELFQPARSCIVGFLSDLVVLINASPNPPRKKKGSRKEYQKRSRNIVKLHLRVSEVTGAAGTHDLGWHSACKNSLSYGGRMGALTCTLLLASPYDKKLRRLAGNCDGRWPCSAVVPCGSPCSSALSGSEYLVWWAGGWA